MTVRFLTLLQWLIFCPSRIPRRTEAPVTARGVYKHADTWCVLKDWTWIRFQGENKVQSLELWDHSLLLKKKIELRKGEKKFNSKSAASKVDGSWMQIKFCFSVLWFITVPSSSAEAGGVLNEMTLHTYWKSNSTTKCRKNRARQMDDLQSSLIETGRGIYLKS